MQKLYKVLKGSLEYKQLILYIIIHSIIFISLILAARYVGSPDKRYTIFTHYISHLGVEARNPDGYIYFNICFIFMGLAYIPILFYIHRRISKKERLLTAKIGSFFWLIASIGIIGIGSIQDEENYTSWGLNLQNVHKFFAYSAILGFLTGIICYFIIIIEDHIEEKSGKRNYFHFHRFLPSIIVFLLVFLGLIITQSYAAINLTRPYEGFFSRTLWEWLLFILSFFEIYSISLALPKSEINLHEERE